MPSYLVLAGCHGILARFTFGGNWYLPPKGCETHMTLKYGIYVPVFCMTFQHVAGLFELDGSIPSEWPYGQGDLFWSVFFNLSPLQVCNNAVNCWLSHSKCHEVACGHSFSLLPVFSEKFANKLNPGLIVEVLHHHKGVFLFRTSLWIVREQIKCYDLAEKNFNIS